MSYQPVTNIEGLEGAYEHVELEDDIAPDAKRVTFEVRKEEVPALTEKEGRKIERSRIYVKVVTNLGNMILDRPLRDEIEWNSEKNAWVIKKLARVGLKDSYIKQYPEAWNAFARGTAAQPIGTPLTLLFKHDPARASMYESYHIHTVEQLANATDGNLESLPMGAREDRAKAQKFIARTKADGANLALNAELEAMRRQMQALQAQNQDLTAKLTEVLTAQIEGGEEAPKRRGRKPANEVTA